jgi:hypothetical protein
METEYIERRFGVIAVKKGFVTPEQIVRAMEIQPDEDLTTGKHRRIGIILHEQGLIDNLQLDEIIQALEK